MLSLFRAVAKIHTACYKGKYFNTRYKILSKDESKCVSSIYFQVICFTAGMSIAKTGEGGG